MMNYARLNFQTTMAALLAALVAFSPVFAEPEDADAMTDTVAQPAHAALSLDASALSAAFDASGVSSYKCRAALKDFEKAVADANAAAVAQRAKVAEVARKYLTDSLEKARTAGDLDKVLVFQKALETVDGEIAGDTEEIVKLRNGRAAQLDKIDKGLVASGLTAAKTLDAHLELQKKEITQKGEIETALKVAAFQKQVEEWAKRTRDAASAHFSAMTGGRASPRAVSEVRRPAAPVSQPIRETRPAGPEARTVTIDANNMYGASIGKVNVGDTIEIQYIGGKWHNGEGGRVAESPDDAGGFGCVLAGVGKLKLANIPKGTKDNPYQYTVDESDAGELFLIMGDSIHSHHDNTGSVRYSVRIIPAGGHVSPRVASTMSGDWSSRKTSYCVIDLSAGPNASSYPVAYLAAPPIGGFNVDAYKTTKLVLKRIEAGSFMMGGSTRTTLSKPFYIGLFKVTQKQWSLVMGDNPSHFSGDKRPVEKVSYNAIRGSSKGSSWPMSNAVDSDSFLGSLRRRTRLDFDLPTEAQWEYACRAGTTTAYSYGDSEDGDYMWYGDNFSTTTHEVGTKLPNPWGLYDMHGNVWEWCLDWNGTLAFGTDPKGSSSGARRVKRGGCWHRNASYCTSSFRGTDGPSRKVDGGGFRLARALPQ